MLLTGAQPHLSKCREHVCRLFKFDHFSGVACCRSSPPLPSHPSVLFPLLVFLPTHPRPPKQKLSFARFSRGCARSEHQSKSSCQISLETVQSWSSASVVGTVFQPILNRFATDLQPFFNRFSTALPDHNRFATDFQPRAKPATVSQPFLNRFSTVFQPFFNRFSTDFQPIAQPIFNRVLKLVALSGHNALETPVCFTKKRGGKDGSAEGGTGQSNRLRSSRHRSRPPPPRCCSWSERGGSQACSLTQNSRARLCSTSVHFWNHAG